MIEIRQKNVLVRVVLVLGLELLLVLGLLLFFGYQGRGIGLAVEGRPGMAGNLVSNPSFEPPASATRCQGGPAPVDWRCYVWGQGDARLQWDPYVAFSGTHSVRIFGLDDDVGAVWVTDPRFSITAGKQYSFSGWIRADYVAHGARACMALHFFDRNDDVVDYYESSLILQSTLSEPRDGWVQVKGSAMAPIEAVKARLDAKLVGEGYVHFDDVIVSEGPIVPFLALFADANPDPVPSTGTLTYVVTVTNTGGSPANSVRLTSRLDSRTTLVYSDTDQASTNVTNGQVYTWTFNELPAEGGSLALTLVVTVNAGIDAQKHLIATFEASADNAEAKIYLVETSIYPDYDFDLSSCGTGLAAPGVAIHCVHTLTNTSNQPTSFTALAVEVNEYCGRAVAQPENIGPVPRLVPVSVTLVFTPSISQPALPRTCTSMLLVVQAPNNRHEKSFCKILVVPDRLDLNMVESSDPVQAGEELTYTLNYTYVGGINAQGLRITVTLDGPAVISDCSPPADTTSETTCLWSVVPDRMGGTGKITVVASVAAEATGSVTSTAQIASRDAGPVTKEITVEVEPKKHRIHLPAIARNCGPGLCDPDFEYDPFQPGCWGRGWSGNANAPLPTVAGCPLTVCPDSVGPFTPASGQFAVLLGDPSLGSGNEHEIIPVGHWWIEQSFPIDSASPPLSLTFHYRVSQYGIKSFDAFMVRINDERVFTDGNDNHDFCCHDMDWPLPANAVKDAGSGWAKVTLPLSPYHTASEITVRFEVWNTDNPDTTNKDYEFYNIWAYVDKVEILY
jgi:uncharacterized repeat protein (TIGR01451 family)